MIRKEVNSMNHIKKYLPYAAILLVVVLVLNYFHNRQEHTEQKLQQAIELTEKQATNINVLQNELKISKQNAELLAESIKKAQTNQVQPITHITVQAPSVEQATNDVKERINKKDSTLPPAALEDTDRTVVAEQPKNEDYQVRVYKINNYRNWYIGACVGVHDKNWYVPVSLQRNFSKNSAVEVQVHFDPHDRNVNGGQILYKRAVNKLFYFF